MNIDNKVDILNTALWNLITGKNQADNNTGGDVSVLTGDINFITEIINDPINTEAGIIDCCKDEGTVNPPTPPDDNPPNGGPPVQPPQQPQPPQPIDQSPPSGGPGPSFSSPSDGQVLGAMTTGQILPATGVSWTLIMSLLSLIMFMLGLYLRLHPGQDPGKN